MKNLLISLVTVAALLVFNSCEKLEDDDTNTVVGVGDVITMPLTLNSFNEIQLDGVADVNISVGEDQAVVLYAQQNIIDVMTWEVTDDKLIIGLEENISIQNTEEIRFDIAVPELDRIEHTGVGDFDLEGETIESFEIYYTGVGDIYAYTLPVNECYIFASGVGSCRVLVNDYLDVELSGVGNVYYRGNPEVNSTVTGVGDLINDN